MKFRSALYNVRGLGSAKDGTRHWWMQRVTAAALVPLGLWLAVSLARVAGMDYQQARAWMASPLVAVLMLATLWALFYHAKLGLQVVIEDYVRAKGTRMALLVLVNFAAILLGLSAALAVLRITLAG
jgi:succinate dehydrogenase / fumarate reductase membrane anchor subunit